MNDPDVQSHSISRVVRARDRARARRASARRTGKRSEPSASPSARGAFGKSADRRIQPLRRASAARRRRGRPPAGRPAGATSAANVPSTISVSGLRKSTYRALVSSARGCWRARSRGSRESTTRAPGTASSTSSRVPSVDPLSTTTTSSLHPRCAKTVAGMPEPVRLVGRDDDDREVVHVTLRSAREAAGSSSCVAASTRSTASWLSTHSTSSPTPSSSCTDASKPRSSRARVGSAMQCRMSPARYCSVMLRLDVVPSPASSSRGDLSIVTARPVPRLIACPTAASDSSASENRLDDVARHG